MQLEQIEVEAVEEIVRPISTPGTDDGAHLFALEHFFQLANATLDGTGEIQIAVQNGVEVERAVSGAAQGCAPGFKVSRPYIAGGGDNPYRVPKAQSGRLDALDLGARHGRDGSQSGAPLVQL